MEIKLDESQQKAVDMALNKNFCVITGGAGYGKTQIIKHIVANLDTPINDVCLCAFAGKAAARMREATGYKASTIHRLLGYNGDKFTVGDLFGKVVIIDEASMISSTLMAEIMKRRPRKLILVGDFAQLPPVGEGQPFHDIINHFPNKVCVLKKCYRASEAIFKASQMIRNGEMPPMEDLSKNEHFKMVNTGNAKETHQYILELVKQGVFDFEHDIILSPRNEDKTNDSSAIDSLNRDILQIVNPHEVRKKANGDEETDKWKDGDRIINTKNNPALDIWNGTTGTVLSVTNKNSMFIKTDIPVMGEDGRETDEVLLSSDDVKNLKHAYALTVHKSQGSQYNKVVLIALSRDSYALLDKAMIYTGVTRAKKECIVIGELNAMRDALRRNTTKQTILQYLLKND